MYHCFKTGQWAKVFPKGKDLNRRLIDMKHFNNYTLDDTSWRPQGSAKPLRFVLVAFLSIWKMTV